MNVTIGQLIQMVRGAIEAEPGDLARNQSLRNLVQLERNAGKYLTKNVYLPEEKADPFGSESIPQSEPEVEIPVETVEPKRTYKRRTTKKKEV
jgi:hypothetical protein